MKVLYDYIPADTSDTSVTITSSPARSGFPGTNLKDLQPVKSWKSMDISASYVLYDFGMSMAFDSLFINGFNFAEFYILGSDDVTFTTVPFSMHINNVSKDEIYDENYMHYWADLMDDSDGTTPFDYRYLKISIPGQTPLFNPTYFKIGNLLVGNCVQIWNPKSGYNVDYVEKRDVKEYDSGYVDEVKVGRTKRVFSGVFDKITDTEYKKFRYSRTPFVLYHDWEGDPTKCYWVKATAQFQKSFDYAAITSHSYSFSEIV